MSKHFLKSKRFWGGLVTIVTLIGNIVMNGPSNENVLALLGALLALYGGIVAQGPLTTKPGKSNVPSDSNLFGN